MIKDEKSDTMNNLLLIDGNSMLFRAYYATLYTNRMSTSSGMPTNAVYGFIMMMKKAIEIIQPDSILVAWDAGKETFRHKQFKEYKGTRKPLDEELKVQFPIVREYLDACHIYRYETEGFEADDIIGSAAKKSADIRTSILTSDRDLLQLIDATTSVLLMKKGITDMEWMTEETFEAKYGLKPIQIIDLKGIMGDASDNIPGVKGIGEKGATKLIQEFNSVEGVYENIDKIKGKQKEKLENDKGNAILSKGLATIYRDMDFPFTLEDCKYDYDMEGANAFFKRYEMNSLISVDMSKPKEADTWKVIHSWTYGNVDKCVFIPVCSKESYLNQKLYGFMAYVDKECVFLSIEDALEDKHFKKMLQTHESFHAWDAKEIYHLLDAYDLPLCKVKEDLHLAAFLLDSMATDTDSLLSSLKIEVPISFRELAKKDKDQEAYNLERLLPTCACMAKNLYKKQDALFEALKEADLMDLYNDVEKPLVSILFEMEKEGIYLDNRILRDIENVVDEKIHTLTTQIYGYANMIFNINSPKQLATVLFDELNLKGGGKKRSTSAEVLEKLKGQHPIVDCLLEYRKYAKIKSTYIDGLRKHIQSDKKIHTTFNQTMTQTGRLSSSEPNLQNISVRDEEGREIRKAFVANKGHVLMSADYSQIELRMLAHMAQEANMMEAFNNDEDIHTKTATLIFDVDKEQVTSSMRRVAKTVNFGIVYGQTEFGLSQQLTITRKEAKDFMDAYFEHYPSIHAYMDSLIDFCKENGYVETMFHRRRTIPEINDKNFMTREFGKRAAMNAPIQGSAADLIKVAMIKVKEAMIRENVKSKMLLQIHDELIFDVVEEEIDLMIQLVKREMENAMQLSVPLKANVEYGKSWYEAK